MTSKKGLFDAIRALDVDGVRAVLGARPQLATSADADGQTPLHRVARVLAPGGSAGTEAVEIARLLLDAGAEVDAVRRVPDERRVFEATPLWYALEQGRNPGVIDLLLERGANPATGLWSVCFAEDLESAEKLLAAGLDLTTDEVSRGALVGSIRARRSKSVAWLIAHGAQVEVTDATGRAALHHAVEARVPMAELELLLSAGARVDREDVFGRTPVDLARGQGRSRVASWLVGRGQPGSRADSR